MTDSTSPSSLPATNLLLDHTSTAMLERILAVILIFIFIPSLCIFFALAFVVFQHIRCFVNYANSFNVLPDIVGPETLQPSITAVSKTADQTNKIEDTNDDTCSIVESTLLLLATTIQDRLAHLTRVEAKAMIDELQSLRSTVGSHGSFFGRDQQAPDAQSQKFDKDAWYGDACLIDVMQWLLKRRSAGDKDNNKYIDEDNIETDIRPPFAGFPEKRSPRIVQEHSHFNPARPAEYNRAMITNFISGLGSWSPGMNPASHVPSGLAGSGVAFENGFILSDGFHGQAHTTDQIQHSTTNSSTVNTERFYFADQIIDHVSNSLQDRLRGLGKSEIDNLMTMLKDHRKKTASKRDKAILNDLRNSAARPQMPFAEKKKAWQKMKVHWDAKVALVDGVMLIVRQTFRGSEDAVCEESFYGDSPAPSVGSFIRSDC